MGQLPISMGNQFTWEKSYQVTDQNHYDNIMFVRSLDSDEEYMGKELVVADARDISRIDRLIKLKLQRDSPYLSRLVRTHKNNDKGLCAYACKYSLVFETYDLNLKDESITRKFKHQQFSEEEILVMVEAVVKGLMVLRAIGQPHQRVCSQNIYVRQDRSIFLSDPWLFSQEYTSIFTLHLNGYVYPSPQKIMYQHDLIEDYDKHLSDYYSLGVVVLELVSQEKMDIIYEKGFRRVLEEKITEYANKIRNEELKAKTMILLSHDPHRREAIEKYYQRDQLKAEHILREREKFITKVTGDSSSTRRLDEETEVPKKIYNKNNRPPSLHRSNQYSDLSQASSLPVGNFPQEMPIRSSLNEQPKTLVLNKYTSNSPVKVPETHKKISLHKTDQNRQVMPQINPGQPLHISNSLNQSSSLSLTNTLAQTGSLTGTNPPLIHISPVNQSIHSSQHGTQLPPAPPQPVFIIRPPQLMQQPARPPQPPPFPNNVNFTFMPPQVPPQPSPALPPSPQASPRSQSSTLKRMQSQASVVYSPPDVNRDFSGVTSKVSSRSSVRSKKSVPKSVIEAQKSIIQAEQDKKSVKSGHKLADVQLGESLNNSFKQKGDQMIEYREKTPKKRKETEYLRISAEKQLVEREQGIKPIKNLNQFHEMIKEANSINEDKSQQQISVVLGHGFNSSYSVVQPHDSFQPQSEQQIRLSLPDPVIPQRKETQVEDSFEDIPKKSISNDSENSFVEVINKETEPVKQAEKKENLLSTPAQRKPGKKRQHSTIKQLSEESYSRSHDSADVQMQQRTVQNDTKNRYVGQMKGGKRQGKGRYIFEDGSYYTGQWRDNRMHGLGCLYYSDGSLAYEGHWHNDCFHGKGRMYNDEAVRFEGAFNFRNMNAVGLMWQVYDGEFFNDRRNGKGKLKLTNGEVFVGDFIDETVHGDGKFYCLSGQVVHGKWVEGIMVKELP